MKKEKQVKMRGNGLNRVYLDFSKVKHMTLEELYGTNPVPITQLTKILWALIKDEGLVIKKSD